MKWLFVFLLVVFLTVSPALAFETKYTTVTWEAKYQTYWGDWLPMSEGYVRWKYIGHDTWQYCYLNSSGACQLKFPVGAQIAWVMLPADDDTCFCINEWTPYGPPNMGIISPIQSHPYYFSLQWVGECGKFS